MSTEEQPEGLSDAPEWLRRKLGAALLEGEEVKLGLESDMNLEGFYEPETVIVTDRRLLLVSPRADQPRCEVPLGEVALVKAKANMGNGVLLVTTWHENLEVLRYSSSLADRAEAFVHTIEDYLTSRTIWQAGEDREENLEHKDEEPAADGSAAAKRCRRCGRLLPPDREVCSACTDKKTVVRKLIGFLKPY